MRCTDCGQGLVAEPACEMFDEHVTFRLTVWRCPQCKEIVEELVTESSGVSGVPRRICYPVREWRDRRRERRVRSRAVSGVPRHAAA